MFSFRWIIPLSFFRLLSDYNITEDLCGENKKEWKATKTLKVKKNSRKYKKKEKFFSEKSLCMTNLWNQSPNGIQTI